MDSNKIKGLAFGARDALRNEVAARIDAILADGSPERLDQPDKVRALESAIADKGLDALVESSAYTWFNRLCALRFMDARGYTPVPAVTPRDGATQPAVLADAVQGIFDPDYGFSRLVRDRVQSVLTGGSFGGSNRTEAAYAALLLAICDHYAGSMPYLFGEAAASSLLMPRNLLAEDSILHRIVGDMDAEACASVEVLGWLYQFYVAERKVEFNASGRKATAEDIAPATQLFTPNWIVRYLVENSLGRLWMLNNPGSALAGKTDYYIAPEGEAENFLRVYSPEELMLCDPACGSGHILVYAFDLLYEIYLEEGYLPEDIPALILQKNLYGMEIDGRAAEIAKFALEMKAREKDPAFFEKRIDANVTVLEAIEFEPGELANAGLLAGNTELLGAFEHMSEVGSLLVPDSGDVALVEDAIGNLEHVGGLFESSALGKLARMKEILEALTRTFDCVVANPPYLGSGKFDDFMSGWVKSHYPDEKSDLCTCFIKRGFSMAKVGGYSSMLTMHSWMFLGSFEKMRQYIIENKAICTMAHLGARAFEQIGGEVVQVTATVFWNGTAPELSGDYVRLVDVEDAGKKREALKKAVDDSGCGWRYRAEAKDFEVIPGGPIAYWAPLGVYSAFQFGTPLGNMLEARQGLSTSNKDRFLRLWWEPALRQTSLSKEASNVRWYPHNKGGEYRKWYGNYDYLIDWASNGAALRSYPSAVLRNPSFYFKESITWSRISSGTLAVRYRKEGSLFDDTGASAFGNQRSLLYCLSLLNSSLVNVISKFMSPTVHFEIGQVSKYPVLLDADQQSSVIAHAESNIVISCTDWDSFETSWDFSTMPLAQPGEPLIAKQFERWSAECDERFSQLKANEEELNRIFARIYHMEDEVPIEVPDDKVSVRRADLRRDVRALVSYGVGCIMGRYSVYRPGLILADAGQTLADFEAKVPDAPFKPDEDAIIPVLDGEWFADDIVARFRAWLGATYGKEVLDGNVSFIEDALGRDLRTYFAKDFYKDHCAIYQVKGSGKRPIYWMFASPKGSFQALIYMHRYTPSTVGQILTKYLREYIGKLNASIAALDGSDRAADQRQADRYRVIVKELSNWERDVIYPLANEHIAIDLDDGVKVNYNKFPHALVKVPGLSTWK